MMLPTRRKKRRLRPQPLHQFKPQHIPVKPNRPLQVRPLQMHMAYADGGVDRRRLHANMIVQFRKCSLAALANRMAISFCSALSSGHWMMSP